jgi:predicted DsbA family dithiol-disulfide isomerase
VPLVILNGHERVAGAQKPNVFRQAIAKAFESSPSARAEILREGELGRDAN